MYKQTGGKGKVCSGADVGKIHVILTVVEL